MTLDEVEDSVPTQVAERLRRSEQALQGIYEISAILTRPARIELTLSHVISALSAHFGLQNGLIALMGEKSDLHLVIGAGWHEESAAQSIDHLPSEMIAQIVSTGHPVLIDDQGRPVSLDWQNQAPIGECVFIGVPISNRDRVIGALTAEFHSADARLEFLPEDTHFMTMVANLVGQTVRVQTLVTRDRERLMEEQRRKEKEFDAQSPTKTDHHIAGIVGQSSAVHAVLNKIRIIARSNVPVLLRGESGTGKELFAQAVHDLSPRKKGPLVKVNCAALPESMLESELFGHEKGAFTGALTQRKGRFELADGGTLFLDEIGEISPAFQAKLLRVLQEGEFQRVGGAETTKVDVRLVAATNRNLEEAVTAGEFRADLYFRISVVPILLAPLRERREDIPLLANEFLRRYNEAHGSFHEFSEDGMDLLCACDFPGNIRELESCVRRTAAFAHGASIQASDFACQNDSCLSSLLWKTKPDSRRGTPLPLADLRKSQRTPVGGLPASAYNSASDSSCAAEPDGAHASDETMSEPAPEREKLIEAMERAGWVQAKAARLLGLSSRQMGYALRKHNIEIKRF